MKNSQKTKISICIPRKICYNKCEQRYAFADNAAERKSAMDSPRTYIAIDLKSFYASVECVARGLDPLSTHLVVADESRTEKTICLAVSPPLKAYGVPGRARLFEVLQQVSQINARRLTAAPGGVFSGSSSNAPELAQHPEYKLDFIIAPPRMGHYVEVSTQVYGIYTRFVAPEDIHVYSIDEVFIDVTPYLRTYQCSARELCARMIHAVLRETGITATVGVGTNLYLAKVAMDIVAKRMPADPDGVRIAELDEDGYRQTLWDHRPLTDFWRVGHGYARKLEQNGLYTMGDIALCSLGCPYSPLGEDKLYRLFGVNAELLIDHAWGWESCTIRDIKAYVPQAHSLSSGQVLTRPYEWDKARLVMREMTEALTLDLVEKGLKTDQLALAVGYDRESLQDPARRSVYTGPIDMDHYGRPVPRMAHGSIRLNRFTSSTRLITEAMTALYDRIADPCLLVRRMYVVAANAAPEKQTEQNLPEQMDMFTDYALREKENAALERENRRQRAVLEIKRRFGKNAILKGMNYLEGATARERNGQIGGHKA